MGLIDEMMDKGCGNEFIKHQNEFKWENVKFPALVKSITFGVMRVAYFYENKEDTGYLYGGYHCSHTEDSVGIASNFILVQELKG